MSGWKASAKNLKNLNAFKLALSCEDASDVSSQSVMCYKETRRGKEGRGRKVSRKQRGTQCDALTPCKNRVDERACM
jgi:hypothetical protein